MNDSCTPSVSDSSYRSRSDLLTTISERFSPEKCAEEPKLGRGHAKTPYAELVTYSNELTLPDVMKRLNVQMNVTENGYTMYDVLPSGDHRLLFRAGKDSAFQTTSESAYKYDDQGKLTQVLEQSASPKFEIIRKNSLTANGWQEEQWNRYGTEFNKMPTITGQIEFKAQSDGTVLRIIKTTDTPLGAAPIGRPIVEIHTIYDAEGRTKTLKQI